MSANEMFGGLVTIETIDRKTGEVIDTFGPEKNMIVDEGVSSFWKRLAKEDLPHAYVFETISIGTDFGDPSNWSKFNPEPPTRSFGTSTQDAIYACPYSDMTFDYPADNIIKITALIDGVDTMTASFPTDYNAEFNSATLRFGNGDTLAYKRFPSRYVSRDVDIRIIWSLTMMNAATYCGAKDPVDDDDTQIYISDNIDFIRVTESGTFGTDYSSHVNSVTALDADFAGLLYSGDSNGNLVKQDRNRNERWVFTRNGGFKITAIKHDILGNVYTSAENRMIKKITEYGSEIWQYEDPDGPFIKLSGIDDFKNVYYVNEQFGHLVKLTPIGSLSFSNKTDHSNTIIDAQTDENGNTVTVGSDNRVRMFDSGGNMTWDFSITTSPSAVHITPSGEILIGYTSTSIQKLNSAGGVIWTQNVLSDWTTDISSDIDDMIYVTTRDNRVHQLSPTGTLNWSYAASDINALAVNRN